MGQLKVVVFLGLGLPKLLGVELSMSNFLKVDRVGVLGTVGYH
jgi:hypothetical protein